MLARVTYVLVIVALGALVGGFFTRESNVLLFVSIGVSLAAIVLVLVGWFRRAREAPFGFEEEIVFADEEEEALVGAVGDEDFAPERSSSSRKSSSRRSTKSKPASKGKARSSSAKAKSSTKSTTARKTTSKAKPSKAKAPSRNRAKPARRKPR